MAWADRRANEYLAGQVRGNVESAPAPTTSSFSGGAPVPGPAARTPEDAGAQGGGPVSYTHLTLPTICRV
eukprot:8693800-Alexandrium_andersonii.AAC.1